MSMSVVEKIIQRENTKKEMLLNDSYIKWLEKFTKEYPNFDDNSWIYCPEEISEEDYNEVRKLGLFFDIVNDYATKNYIYSESCDFGKYYALKYNDVILELYVVAGQGVVFGCDRLLETEESLASIIEYEDLKANKENDRTKFIKGVIDDLSIKLSELIRLGVPIETIESCINDLKKSN